MFKPLEACIGLRYVRSRRRNGFISFITFSSLLGTGLGVATLIVVLSVMNGFEKVVREKILSMTAHATISGFNGSLNADWQDLQKRASAHQQVLGVAPYIQKEAMLTRGSLVRGAILRGLLAEDEQRVSEIGKFMQSGRLEDLKAGEFGIILGADLARGLALSVGEKVTVVVPSAVVTPAGIVPRMKRFTVVGVFKADHAQFDSNLALLNLKDAARLFRFGDQVAGLRIKLADPLRAPALSRDLAQSLGGNYWVVDWTQLNANWFRALQLEKTMMFLILTLIVAVAAFNIVSTLVMVVTDKQADIAILRTLGATPKSIMGIFIVQGSFIGLFGTLLGVIGGVSLALNVENLVPRLEEFLGRKILPADVYYITQVPSQLQTEDVLTITALAFLLTVLATLYPAWRASRTQPAEALRYE